jgi:hypothetical protein
MATVLLDSSVIFDALNRKRGRPELLSDLIREGRAVEARLGTKRIHAFLYRRDAGGAVAIENKLRFLTDNRKHFPMRELMLYPLPA